MKITENALIQINSVTPENEYFRISVAGGGCSGMSYVLKIDQFYNLDKDKLINDRVIVDNKSYLFIDTIELDYISSLNKTGFVFNNPRAKRVCGCGESFA